MAEASRGVKVFSNRQTCRGRLTVLFFMQNRISVYDGYFRNLFARYTMAVANSTRFVAKSAGGEDVAKVGFMCKPGRGGNEL